MYCRIFLIISERSLLKYYAKRICKQKQKNRNYDYCHAAAYIPVLPYLTAYQQD